MQIHISQLLIVLFHCPLMLMPNSSYGLRDDAFGWGISLQSERSRAEFPIRSFCWIMSLWWTHPLTEMNNVVISWVGGACGWCVGLTSLPLSSAYCLEILGSSTSWSTKVLSKPEMGKFLTPNCLEIYVTEENEEFRWASFKTSDYIYITIVISLFFQIGEMGRLA